MAKNRPKRIKSLPKRRSKSPKREARGIDDNLARPGGLSYIEILALDVRQSARFYSKVLGWKSRGKGAEATKFSDPTGHLIGRWIPTRQIPGHAGMLPFFYVPNVNQAARIVLTTHGQIIRAPYAEGNLRVAIARDPAGNLLGLWQNAR
jgi:predicted enzyme related to lactoylglutathione lyase